MSARVVCDGLVRRGPRGGDGRATAPLLDSDLADKLGRHHGHSDGEALARILDASHPVLRGRAQDGVRADGGAVVGQAVCGGVFLTLCEAIVPYSSFWPIGCFSAAFLAEGRHEVNKLRRAKVSLG